MTLADWMAETRQRYRDDDPLTATKRSAMKFAVGANRRTADRWVGDVWWGREWDVLVILDGARVDVMREVVGSDVRSTWSAASTSIDWIDRHFADRYRDEWEDAAYVTANPFAAHDNDDARSADLDAKPLGHFDPVYRRAWGEVEGIKTTPPTAVTDAAIRAHRETDCDRLIVHYMQPHQPFRSRPEWENVFSNMENLVRDVTHGGADIWGRCRDGEIDREELWAAYLDNLRWVWQDVTERLLANVDGDVLVTADHGNGMGEWGAWSHRGGQLAPTVRKVPVVGPLAATDLETVQPDVSRGQTDTKVAEQLEALGYR